MNKSKYPTPSHPVVQRAGPKSNVTETPYLNVRELALYLRKSPAAIHNMVYRKQLTAYKPGGKLLFRKDEVDRWINRSRLMIGYGS